MSVDEQSHVVNIQGEEVELASFCIHWWSFVNTWTKKGFVCLNLTLGERICKLRHWSDMAMPVPTIHIHTGFDLLFVQSPKVPLFCALTQGFIRSWHLFRTLSWKPHLDPCSTLFPCSVTPVNIFFDVNYRLTIVLECLSYLILKLIFGKFDISFSSPFLMKFLSILGIHKMRGSLERWQVYKLKGTYGRGLNVRLPFLPYSLNLRTRWQSRNMTTSLHRSNCKEYVIIYNLPWI